MNALSRALSRGLRGRLPQGARPLSSLAISPFTQQDGDHCEFPRRARGLEYELNNSLAADGLTTRGEAYRNAPVRDLLEFAGPRGAVRVTKERALEVMEGAFANAGGACAAFATDVLAGTKVMDVEEYEGRLASLRDDCLSYAPRLFVEDAALGSSRASEVRIRVVTDSPLVALLCRSMLQRIPLYSPQGFPRTLTVYAATLAQGSGIAAMHGQAAPYTVVDVDPTAARGVVLAAGTVPFTALLDAIAAGVGSLAATGGYRHRLGGSHVPVIDEAQRAGVAHWYFRDGHTYDAPGAPHPDLLLLRGDVIVGSGSSSSGSALVLRASGASTAAASCGSGSGSVAFAAAAAGRLFAPHHALWEGNGSLSAAWAGALLPKGSAPSLPLVRGALIAQGATCTPLAQPTRVAAAPGRVLIVGGSGPFGVVSADAAARVTAAARLPEAAVAKVAARLSAAGAVVEAVASDADACKALAL